MNRTTRRMLKEKATVKTKLTLSFSFFLVMISLFFCFSLIRTVYANDVSIFQASNVDAVKKVKSFKSLKSVNFDKYHSEIKEGMKNAEIFLERYPSLPLMKDRLLLAIVLDIDETAISTIEYMRVHHLERKKKTIEKAIKTSTHPIQPVLTFYREAVDKRFVFFFISNRETSLRTQTTLNLKEAGYKKWEGLILRPKDFKGTVATFKQQARKWIRDQGYRIVLNIGDQESDLKEWNGEGDRTKQIKLPNPFYTVQ